MRAVQLLEGYAGQLLLNRCKKCSTSTTNMSEDDVIEAMRLAKNKLEEQRIEIAALKKQLAENHERAEEIIMSREREIDRLREEYFTRGFRAGYADASARVVP